MVRKGRSDRGRREKPGLWAGEEGWKSKGGCVLVASYEGNRGSVLGDSRTKSQGVPKPRPQGREGRRKEWGKVWKEADLQSERSK